MKIINNCIMILSFMFSFFAYEYLFLLGLIPLFGLSLLIRRYNKNLEFVYLIFLFMSYVLGYIYDWYNTIYYFDALVHSFFGLVGSVFALPLLKKFKCYDSKKKLFNVVFIIVVTLALASFWEIIEFAIDKFFVNANMQRSLNNTMKDIISALLFSIMYSFIYIENSKFIENIFISRN